MLQKDKIIQDKYNGIHPICQCGCGQKTRYEPNKKDYCKWIHGHQSRVVGHFGDLKSEKRVNAIINTRKQKFQSGEYDHILKQVSQPRSEEIKQKISKSGTGVSRPKADGFGIGRIHSQTTKDKMSEIAKDKWITGDIGKRKYYTSKLEKTFANILDLLDIKYEILFYAKDIKAFYDFYIPEYNTIIEVDGDFWHCNPDRFPIPQYESQKKNLIRDKEKNEWAISNGYKIIRIWENDINNNIQQVKQILTETLKN